MTTSSDSFDSEDVLDDIFSSSSPDFTNSFLVDYLGTSENEASCMVPEVGCTDLETNGLNDPTFGEVFSYRGSDATEDATSSNKDISDSCFFEEEVGVTGGDDDSPDCGMVVLGVGLKYLLDDHACDQDQDSVTGIEKHSGADAIQLGTGPECLSSLSKFDKLSHPARAPRMDWQARQTDSRWSNNFVVDFHNYSTPLFAPGEVDNNNNNNVFRQDAITTSSSSAVEQLLLRRRGSSNIGTVVFPPRHHRISGRMASNVNIASPLCALDNRCEQSPARYRYLPSTMCREEEERGETAGESRPMERCYELLSMGRHHAPADNVTRYVFP